MGILTRLFRKIRLVSPPVNIIGPFVLPEPNDPRWVGEWQDDPWAEFRIGCFKVLAGVKYKNGLIYAGSVRLVDSLVLPKRHRSLEDKYAMAVFNEYRRNHPTMEVRLDEHKMGLQSIVKKCLSDIQLQPDDSQASPEEVARPVKAPA